MSIRIASSLLSLIALITIISTVGASTSAATVSLRQTPNGGIQPQAVIDANNVIHLIYFLGDPAHGDIYYVTCGVGVGYSSPIRVNSEPQTAIATGTIRGAQIALGRSGAVYVVWNGVGAKAANGYPVLYTAFARLVNGQFTPQRNLLPAAEQVDGGGSVAADTAGNVYVTWHNTPTGNGEASGGVFIAVSSDDGRTFTAGRLISNPGSGQCGCCAMKAFVDRENVYVLYRSAAQGTHRDTMLLVSHDHGQTFQTTEIEPWMLNACPMSSFSIASASTGVLAAWETKGQVSFAGFDQRTKRFGASAPGSGQRKYPIALQNRSGEILLAWVEGSGWARGGRIAWQTYDKTGAPTTQSGGAGGVPAWSLISAVALPDGGFAIFY